MSYIDARLYDGPGELDCDICIAGAGAAGLTLALTLARPGRRIILLEAGGMSFDGNTQALYRGKLSGVSYFDLASCRLRFFGGTTGHWGGVCVMPRRIDYEPRPALSLPGWPVGYDEILPYLLKAGAQLGFDPKALVAPALAAMPDPENDDPPIETASKILQTEMVHQSQPEYRHFNPRYVETVKDLPDTDVFLNASLTHIGLSENGRSVRAFTVKTLTGKTFTIRPKIGILACHAIENTRLLLGSNDVVTTGIGNAGDQLGRNFMDHIHVRTGRLVPDPARMPHAYFYDPLIPKSQRKVTAQITPNDRVRLENDMLHYLCVLDPQFSMLDDRTGDSVSRLVKSFFRPFDTQMARDIGTVLDYPRSATASTLARFGLRERAPLYCHFTHHIEQWPNPDSRVTLSGERDALGMPVVALNWALGEADFHTLARGQEILARELAALGWGRVAMQPMTPDYIKANVIGNWHHMGTTRMSDAPRAGVVDRNCRVHGTENLYVAGSAVFPNATSAAPTIHLIAFALRLADHIESSV